MVALSISATFFVSCSKDEAKGPDIDSANKNANIAGADNTVSRLEIPHLNSNYDYICHTLTNGDVNYTIEYDKTLCHARWVAYTYDSHSAQRNWTMRTDAWAVEPFYNNNKQYQVAVQYFNGYNRGHLVGSAERYYSQEANMQTFYMSNMSPMISAFNSTYWGEIEDLVRDVWGRSVINQNNSEYYGGTLYVVKGGTLQATTANPDPIMGYCPIKNMMGNSIDMPVPRYYFIACLFVSSTGSAKAIGFKLEHKNYNNTSDTFLSELRRSAACSIDELEAFTGIDFFCNLSDGVENAVESTYNISQWAGI